MRKIYLLCLILLIFISSGGNAQDTFSIVAADSATRQVGSAGASCVDLFSAGISNIGFIGDLLPDTGAINTQAYYLAANQNNARARMRAGDTPGQIITWLTGNDVQSNAGIRQYGIVGFTANNASAAAHTGSNCQNYKGHITGSINGIYYSIQGNILLGAQVLDSMESRFRNEQGDLACRLMAALQGAKMPGADTRCAPNGTSTLFAFVKVAQPTDSYGNPSFYVGVRTHNNDHIEPIDTLQQLFDLQHNCNPTGINELNPGSNWTIHPNPASNEIMLSVDPMLVGSHYRVTDLLGRTIHGGIIETEVTRVDIYLWARSMYLIYIENQGGKHFIKN